MFDFDELEEKYEAKRAPKEPKKATVPKPKAAQAAQAAQAAETKPKAAPRSNGSPAPMNRKIRVLALHGGGSNANIMQFQVMPLRRILGDQAEWVFLNGGRTWKFDEGQQPPEIMKTLAAGMPFYGWYAVETKDKTDRPYQEKLFDPEVDFTYTEVEAGVDRVLAYIKDEGPVDVLVGFSQGCIVSHLMAAVLRERGEAIPWRLSIFFNGMRVRDRRYERLFQTALELPSIMVFGRQDEFYNYGKASQMALYQEPLVLEHDEGHKFPSAGPRAKEIYEEVAKQVYFHCGVAPRNKI
ncbi:unnamed protein product [Effrenium voratum]|uniref:Serine hydrolase domain-containing protein n=1 Tax=Effrenium voratum TaxID=2562239 RepID=A0AA36HLN8_9DINO|nr:unnamed protein product [Effrenium voratum]